jgi:hypothetical protein
MQKINLSEGCVYNCPFCFNCKMDFVEFPIPEIKSNEIVIYDPAFLSKKKVIDVINELGSKKFNDKVVYYELLQGINLKDLTPEIAEALKINRFINIRFAWDGSYSKNNMYRVLDGIKMLVKARYKPKDLMCYILSNYYVSLRECLYKNKDMLINHIKVCNCVYRKNYLDPKVYYDHWTKQEVEYYKQECRMNNQLVDRKGYDPEIEKRLVRSKILPQTIMRN